MADLTPDLDKKTGPFTLAQWAGVIGLGVAVGLGIRFYRARNGDPTPTEPADDAGEEGTVYVDQQPDALAGSPIRSSSPFPTSSVYPGTSTTTGYASNDEWGQAAIARLVSIGKSPTGSTNAVARFLGSEGLTSGDRELVDLAIQLIGATPTPVASQTIDEPTQTQAPNGYDPNHRVRFVTRRGNSASYWGTPTGRFVGTEEGQQEFIRENGSLAHGFPIP